MCLCTHGAHRSQSEGIGSPGAGVTGICEVPDVGAGTELWFLFRVVSDLNC